MTKIKYIVAIVFCGIVFSCGNDDTMQSDTSLAALIQQNEFEVDNVIACAASSNSITNSIITYVYPRSEATELSYYETNSILDDKNNYRKYQRINLEPINLFNGYLKKFTREVLEEKWVIITFKEAGKLHLSNPIRLKHLSKPTQYTDTIQIDTTSELMPIFTWTDGIRMDNKIYFQVISNTNHDLLSGTYTLEKQFQYYKLDNVVLNITNESPPQLNPMNPYYITLMGVSEDNWVNLFIEKTFIPQ